MLDTRCSIRCWSRIETARSVHRAAAPGATYLPAGVRQELDARPNEVDEDELRTAVST